MKFWRKKYNLAKTITKKISEKVVSKYFWLVIRTSDRATHNTLTRLHYNIYVRNSQGPQTGIWPFVAFENKNINKRTASIKLGALRLIGQVRHLWRASHSNSIIQAINLRAKLVTCEKHVSESHYVANNKRMVPPTGGYWVPCVKCVN